MINKYLFNWIKSFDLFFGAFLVQNHNWLVQLARWRRLLLLIGTAACFFFFGWFLLIINIY